MKRLPLFIQPPFPVLPFQRSQRSQRVFRRPESMLRKRFVHLFFCPGTGFLQIREFFLPAFQITLYPLAVACGFLFRLRMPVDFFLQCRQPIVPLLLLLLRCFRGFKIQPLPQIPDCTLCAVEESVLPAFFPGQFRNPAACFLNCLPDLLNSLQQAVPFLLFCFCCFQRTACSRRLFTELFFGAVHILVRGNLFPGASRKQRIRSPEDVVFPFFEYLLHFPQQAFLVLPRFFCLVRRFLRAAHLGFRRSAFRTNGKMRFVFVSVHRTAYRAGRAAFLTDLPAQVVSQQAGLSADKQPVKLMVALFRFCGRPCQVFQFLRFPGQRLPVVPGSADFREDPVPRRQKFQCFRSGCFGFGLPADFLVNSLQGFRLLFGLFQFFLQLSALLLRRGFFVCSFLCGRPCCRARFRLFLQLPVSRQLILNHCDPGFQLFRFDSRFPVFLHGFPGILQNPDQFLLLLFQLFLFSPCAFQRFFRGFPAVNRRLYGMENH